MMNDEQQDVFLCRSAEQTDPHDRPAFEIERALSFLDEPGLQLIRAPARGIDLFEPHRQMFVDPLKRFAGMHHECGAQGRMALYQRLKRAPESRNVYIVVDAAGKTDIVNRAFRCELGQEPDALLIIGERMKRLRRARLSPQEFGKQRALFIGARSAIGRAACPVRIC